MRRSAGSVGLPEASEDLEMAFVVDIRNDAGGRGNGPRACCGGGVGGRCAESWCSAQKKECELYEGPWGEIPKETIASGGPCALTFLGAKLCMMIPENLQFVGFEIGALYFNALLLSVVQTYSWQVLDGDSDINSHGQVFAEHSHVCLQ